MRRWILQAEIVHRSYVERAASTALDAGRWTLSHCRRGQEGRAALAMPCCRMRVFRSPCTYAPLTPPACLRQLAWLGVARPRCPRRPRRTGWPAARSAQARTEAEAPQSPRCEGQSVKAQTVGARNAQLGLAHAWQSTVIATGDVQSPDPPTTDRCAESEEDEVAGVELRAACTRRTSMHASERARQWVRFQCHGWWRKGVPCPSFPTATVTWPSSDGGRGRLVPANSG